MTYYVHIKDKKIVGHGQARNLTNNVINIEISEEIYNNIKRYEYINNELVEIKNYDELQAKEQRKQEILEELNALDLKSIRALRANEAERLQELENQAIELRKEYNSL